jgi:antitoxin CptB
MVRRIRIEIMAIEEISDIGAPPISDDRDTVETLRRKLAFHAWRRGTSEADLLLGTFADQCLMGLATEELRQFEYLLEEDDPSIDDWVAGRQLVPKKHDNLVMALLRRFRVEILACPGRAIGSRIFNGKTHPT